MADMASSALYLFSILLLIAQVSTMAVQPPTAGTCPPGSLMCLDGSQCYSATLRCDGNADCADTTDEYACEGIEHSGEKNITCPENSIPCKSGDQCIEKHQRCDKIEDCTDGSDEYNCPVDCKGEHLFLCGNGNCISTDLKCNGEDNCGDYSDEVGCGPAVDESTASSETKASTVDVKPVDTEATISNDIHVPPEVNSMVNCGDEVRCGSGECLLNIWVCDGNTDCADGSDEIGCGNSDGSYESTTEALNRTRKHTPTDRLMETQLEVAKQERFIQQHLYKLKVEELETRNEAARIELEAAQVWKETMMERREQQRKEHSLSLASFQGSKPELRLNHTETEVTSQNTASPVETV